MDVAHVQMLFGYTKWANGRVLDAAAALSDEPFRRDLGSSFPSVRDTLSHIAAADWIWLERWHGRSPSAPPPWFPLETPADLRARWDVVMEARDVFLAAQTDDTLAQPLEYANMKGQRSTQPLWQQLQHVANHGTYHRGQVTTMIRQLGGTMVSTDLVTYLRECPYDAAGRPAGASGQSVSFFITRQQQDALRRLGYADEAIGAMKPEDAHRLLNAGRPSGGAGGR